MSRVYLRTVICPRQYSSLVRNSTWQMQLAATGCALCFSTHEHAYSPRDVTFILQFPILVASKHNSPSSSLLPRTVLRSPPCFILCICILQSSIEVFQRINSPVISPSPLWYSCRANLQPTNQATFAPNNNARPHLRRILDYASRFFYFVYYQ